MNATSWVVCRPSHTLSLCRSRIDAVYQPITSPQLLVVFQELVNPRPGAPGGLPGAHKPSPCIDLPVSVKQDVVVVAAS
jgi:hypothetical protein